ncbi:MAG: zf-HC2 domain-containing protein [Myxococcales bacterium]
MPTDPCEKALLERIARGDREALESLAEQHVAGLLHYASSCCHSRADAEAAVRRALSTALTQVPGADCVSLRAWLYRLVRAACEGAEPRRPSGEFLLPLPSASPDCTAYRDLLSDYLDGELGPAERSWLEGHLATCQDCSRLHDGLRLTVESLHHTA